MGRGPGVPVARLGEDALVRLFARGAGAGRVARAAGAARTGRNGAVPIGIGDDAALVRPPRGAGLLLTSDLMAEGVHFRRSWCPPADLGWKLAAVNASDVAAMGGRPLWALLSVALPATVDVAFVAGVARGLRAAARRFGFALVGGDTCASRGGVFLSLALAGAAGPATMTRAGARPDDLLFVTGHLGASALGLAALERRGGRVALPPSLRACVRRHLRPEPRLAFGAALARAGLATACMDVSDGLSRDLGRLCVASGVGAEVLVPALPLLPGTRRAARFLRRDAGESALHGGEEYELLFTARPAHAARVAALGRRLGLRVTRIGRMLPRRAGLAAVGGDGRRSPLAPRSWEHF